MKNGWRTFIPLAALITLAVAVAYTPVLHAGFVFDDPVLITDNPLIKASDGLHRFWFTTEAPDYYPLSSTLFWLEWRWWGARPMGYHVVNVLLHAANTVLIWVVLRRLKIPGAWLAALIFGLHPVNVATVAWVSEQKNTLSMLFYLVAILLYLRFDEDGSWGWYAASLAAFLLALLSKTAVVMLPVVLLGCVWWMHDRVRWRDILRSAPFVAASVIMALVTIWFQHGRALAGHTTPPPDFLSRLAVAGWVPWFYISKAFLPVNLTVVYPKWQVGVSRCLAWLPGVVLAGVLVWCWWKRKTWGRPVLLGVGYFLAMLLPVSGLVYQGFNRFSSVADHWQYYSIIGIIALVVAGVEKLCLRLGGRSRSTATVVSIAILMLLVVGTWKRGSVYANDVTLWRDNVAKNPAPWPHNLLGCALEQTGNFEEAIREFQEALRMDPGYAEAHGNLGDTLLQAGKIHEAMKQWQQAIQLNPRYPQARYNLGVALALQGRTQEAIDQWEEALRIKPDYAEAHYNLGVAMEKMGRLDSAVEHYRRALIINPDYAAARKRYAQLRGLL